MSRDSVTLPPFPPPYRASGLLLQTTSLPSRYGIGDLGPAALSWIDRLVEAGQSWWQSLPLGPPGAGNSPYSPISSFALNPLLVSPDWLIEDELARPGQPPVPAFPESDIDYTVVTQYKRELLEKAWTIFRAGARTDLRAALEEFRNAQAHWLEDYALFRALRERFAGAYYLQWPEVLVRREPAALDRVRHELADHIGMVCFGQFLLFRQSDRLRAYARSKGLGLIGDLPFFVSSDSGDIWSHPELFLLDGQRKPRVVAGVPPDYFSATGQLWGNPVYDWDALRQTGYRWCIDRLRALLAHVDVIRLDHFRGFAAAWEIPSGAPTAQSGHWVPGPGADFFQAVQRELGDLPFIVEDLGQITPDVYALRDQFQLPGSRVLQFAFDGHSDNPHLPQNYVTNTVVYTGTHDNPTTRGWFEDLPEDQRHILRNDSQRPLDTSADAAPELMRLAWASKAALALAPVQDLLNLGKEARMNVPGRPDGNWRWRLTEGMLTDGPFEWLRDLTKSSNRFDIPGSQESKLTEAALAAVDATRLPISDLKVAATDNLGLG